MKRFLLTSMKRVFIFVLLISFGSIILNAQPISEDVARKKAASFFLDNKKGIKAAKGKEDHSALEDSLKLIEGDDAYYIFNLESKGGYVIVSGDDRMPDVLGYSTNGLFDTENMPDNLKAWLEGYKEQYQYLQEHEEARTVKETITTSETRTKVYPRLTTRWSQSGPYNAQCPKIGIYRTITGCVATAMAQIMNYHQWPKQTSKTIEGYSTTYCNVPTIGITTIDWENMLDSYTYGNTPNFSEANSNAVSTLMLLCGASVKMDYRFEASAASLPDAKNALVEYFDYDDSTIRYLERSKYNDEEWTQLIYDEIKSKRPVLYAGNPEESDAGHAFVIDGYDTDDYFHVNWGWSSGNGYFLLGALKEYNYDQEAIVGIQRKGNMQYKYAYAEYKDQNVTFYYDDKREQRQGQLNTSLNGPLFIEKVSEIETVNIEPSFAEYHKLKTTSEWFLVCSNLSNIIGLQYLNTENVTNMYGMFAGCSNLKSLNLSSMNTSKVTNMSSMFDSCEKLQTLDVSNFDTRNVIDMTRMFHGCGKLTRLDLSSFDTSNVTSMHCMFYLCTNLEELDISNFKTHNVQNMRVMFYGCGVKKLDVSSFDTKNVKTMESMFGACLNLTSLDVSKFDTHNVTDMSGMFSYCYCLTTLDVSNFDTQNVTDMSVMFGSCRNLSSLDVSNFNTSKVTDMSGMFEACNNLTSLDVSKFDTQNVTNMEYMFDYCQNLTSLDVSSFDVSKVTKMNNMFHGCNNLATIYCAEGTDWSGVVESTNMFYGCSNLRGQCSDRATYYSSDLNNATLARICTSTQDGYFTLKGTEVKTAKVLWDSTKKTLVFFYDGKAYEQGSTFVSDGTTYTAEWVKEWKLDNEYPSWKTWVKDDNDVTIAVFDDSFREFKPINCKQLFSQYYNLENIVNLKNLNTSDVTDMNYMFYYCSKLKSLDVSNFNTQNVTNMIYMFAECGKLTSLDVSKFDTQNVTNMGEMFGGCQNLTSLDVSNFNTQNVTVMCNMFWGCNNLTSLDVSNFDTQNVTSMGGMFAFCSNLTSLDVSKFNTQNVTDMRLMFYDCSNLASLDVSKFNTSNVTDMSNMFYGCNNLTSLDVSSFDVSIVTNMNSMFGDCNNLATIYCSEGTDWSGVAKSTNMFYGCWKLKGYAEGRTTNYLYNKTDATLARICTPTQDGYFTDKNTTITGIRAIEDVDLNNSEIYNVQGVRVPTHHKGLNIIKMSDGSTKKVMVK